ncbi:terpenoid synthase [Hymenopellis radicata]|nr:terpenoid synthase [Hymenopellis radicata]
MTTTVIELLPPRVSESTGVITIPNGLPVEDVSTERKLRDRTRGILLKYLSRCGFSPVPPVYNQAFEDLVFAEARSYGWDVASMHSTLIVGAGITSASYTHLTDVKTLLYIAIFTSLVVVIDDLCTKDAEILQGVSEFIRVLRPVLPPTAADIIVWGTLRFISGCYLESLESAPAREQPSEEYCYYLRNLSGIPEPYGMFIFPPTIPFTAYKDGIPMICDYINFNNDLLSFYKEEFAGEDNMVTYLAQVQNLPKFQVLEELADKTARAYERGVSAMKTEEARKAFIAFARGYVDFHTGLKRYKLVDLGITQQQRVAN